MGGPQVQNRGTLVGNVCNASPAADGVPALLALDASVRVQRLGATRDIPLGKFITGNRKTILGADELVSVQLSFSTRTRYDFDVSETWRQTTPGHLHRDGRGNCTYRRQSY